MFKRRVRLDVGKYKFGNRVCDERNMLLCYPQRFVGNKPNLYCFQHMYRRSDADNFGSVRFLVR